MLQASKHIMCKACESAMHRATGTVFPPPECWGHTDDPRFHTTRHHIFCDCPDTTDPAVKARAFAKIKDFMKECQATQTAQANASPAAMTTAPQFDSNKWKENGFPSTDVQALRATIVDISLSDSARRLVVANFKAKLVRNEPPNQGIDSLAQVQLGTAAATPSLVVVTPGNKCSQSESVDFPPTSTVVWHAPSWWVVQLPPPNSPALWNHNAQWASISTPDNNNGHSVFMVTPMLATKVEVFNQVTQHAKTNLCLSSQPPHVMFAMGPPEKASTWQALIDTGAGCNAGDFDCQIDSVHNFPHLARKFKTVKGIRGMGLMSFGGVSGDPTTRLDIIAIVACKMPFHCRGGIPIEFHIGWGKQIACNVIFSFPFLIVLQADSSSTQGTR